MSLKLYSFYLSVWGTVVKKFCFSETSACKQGCGFNQNFVPKHLFAWRGERGGWNAFCQNTGWNSIRVGQVLLFSAHHSVHILILVPVYLVKHMLQILNTQIWKTGILVKYSFQIFLATAWSDIISFSRTTLTAQPASWMSAMISRNSSSSTCSTWKLTDFMDSWLTITNHFPTPRIVGGLVGEIFFAKIIKKNQFCSWDTVLSGEGAKPEIIIIIIIIIIVIQLSATMANNVTSRGALNSSSSRLFTQMLLPLPFH